jgi:hypothetical protein
MDRKKFLQSVTGAITCAPAGNPAIQAFSEAATLPYLSSAGPLDRMATSWGSLRQEWRSCISFVARVPDAAKGR